MSGAADFGGTTAVREAHRIDQVRLAEWLRSEVGGCDGPLSVEQFKGGKRTVAAFFVGQVMKASKGQANPAVLNELVIKKLDAV